MRKKTYKIYEMDMLWLNIVSVLLLIIMIFLTFFIQGGISISSFEMNLTLLCMIPYLILHEILHSISYVIHGAKFKKVTYGAHLEKGVLCCLCKQNISKRNILTSLLYPFIFIGIITYIVGLLLSNNILIFLSIINISGCSGDLIMFIDLLSLNDFEYSEFDNPTAFALYSEKPIKRNLFGLKYKEEKESIERKDLKKISISKTSIIIFIILIILAIINITFGG